MAYTGVLRQESAGKIHGWACDYCGLKAETTKREPPQEWRDTRNVGFHVASLHYTTSPTLCTHRCVAMWNGEPWPPKDRIRTRFDPLAYDDEPCPPVREG